MKSATVSELKNQLSKFLRYVKQGEVVLVLDRGIAIAEIQPRSRKTTGSEDRLQALESKGVLRRGGGKALKDFSLPESKRPSGVLEALLEERRSGR